MRKVIEDILNMAVNAPSGNNSQPWKFVVEGNKIAIWNLPQKDNFLFNYRQRGSYIAHGTIIENILIIASQKGYGARVNVFPEGSGSDLVSEIVLEEGGEKYRHDYLFSYILKRTTNRRPYEVTPLKTEDEKKMRDFIESIRDRRVGIFLFQNREVIGKLSRDLSIADRLIFENFNIHQAFFAKVSWTREEEKARGEGLYVGTKELSPPMAWMFKHVFKYWNNIKLLQAVKISEKAAKKREYLYNQCSAIGMVAAQDDTPESFVAAGRALQLFWLTITSVGLNFQPVSAGLLYIGQRLQKESPQEFTPKQIKFIREAYRNILETFNHPELVPTFSFRIGYAISPTASSIKRPPDITWIEE